MENCVEPALVVLRGGRGDSSQGGGAKSGREIIRAPFARNKAAPLRPTPQNQRTCLPGQSSSNSQCKTSHSFGRKRASPETSTLPRGTGALQWCYTRNSRLHRTGNATHMCVHACAHVRMLLEYSAEKRKGIAQRKVKDIIGSPTIRLNPIHLELPNSS